MSDANRYRGRTPGEAMKKAREELGEDARLVAARRVSAPEAPPVYEVHVIAGAAREAAPDASLDALRREIESLRQSLGAPAPVAAPRARAAVSVPAPRDETPGEEQDPQRGKWIELLRRRGVEPSLAQEIARGAARRAPAVSSGDALAPLRGAVSWELEAAASPDPVCDRSTLFVGPSGCGKTTVLAKAAAELVAQGESPVLVATDGESIAGEDTLEAVATALGLRFEAASLEGRLAEIAQTAEPGTIFLVDPPGRSPCEPGGLSAIEAICRAMPGLEVVAVVPCTMDREEARLLVDSYAALGAKRAVLTKLDEVARPGRVLELIRTVNRPIAWVTHGRQARGAGCEPTDPILVERILGTTLTVERSA